MTKEDNSQSTDLAKSVDVIKPIIESEPICTDKSMDLDINKVLAEVIIKGVKEINNDLRNRVKKILDKRKYGITPTQEESKGLWEINNSKRYERLEECIGNHWSLKLLNVGLYISYLNDEGSKKSMIKRIEKEVYDEYEEDGLRVLRMSTTGVVANIINYLSDLKMRKNLSEIQVGVELDRIIDDWEKITIFVKSCDYQDKLKTVMLDYMKKRLSMFFVFAYGSASIPAYKTIAEINSDGLFRD